MILLREKLSYELNGYRQMMKLVAAKCFILGLEATCSVCGSGVRKSHCSTKARDIFISKLKDCGHDRNYIEYITSHAQFLRPHWSSSVVPFVRFRADILWFVLPYHPLWVHAGLKQSLTKLIEGTLLRDLLCEAFDTVTPPQIRISWSIKTLPFGSNLLEW